MTDIYVQREEVALRKGARRDQILGMVLQLAGLGLIPVAVFFSYWVFFAVAVALAGGIWLTQRFYSSPKEYEYAFTGTKTRRVARKHSRQRQKNAGNSILGRQVFSLDFTTY